MAQDRMNDDLDRNMGRAGQQDDKGLGQQQSPGRNPGHDQQTGQKGAGQKNNPLEDDDFGKGGKMGQSGQGAHQGRPGGGGQNQ